MFSSAFLFFDIGGPEIMLIMLVALLLFGGDKLPGLAKGLGKGIRDFKDASEGVKREIANQIDSYENKKTDDQAATAEVLPEHEDQSVVNRDPEPEGHVANTIPAGESHVANDSPELAANHSEEPHVSADKSK
jgi:sec-independent protein translocase protein TatA